MSEFIYYCLILVLKVHGCVAEFDFSWNQNNLVVNEIILNLLSHQILLNFSLLDKKSSKVFQS